MHRIASARLGLALLAPALSAAALLVAAPARADVLASPCTVEHFERYLGERCLMCEASEYEPERCRQVYAPAGLRQRCSGDPLGSTVGFSMWGELWCLPPEKKDAPLPEALPPIERAQDSDAIGDGALPPIPAGFRDTQPLAADGGAEGGAAEGGAAAAREGVGPEASAAAGDRAAPAAAAAPAKGPSPGGCGGCSLGGPEPAAAGVGLLLLVLAARSRRGATRT